MPSTDLKTRFAEIYEGDVKDPILRSLLDTIEGYQRENQDDLLISAYSQRRDRISDGFFEVLRRHLFGQMFPGPAYVVAEVSLREVETTPPIKIEQRNYFSMQDPRGEKVLFAPQFGLSILPSFSNAVRVDTKGDALVLVFSISTEAVPDEFDGNLQVYCDDVDLLVLERIRCRIMHGQPEETIESHLLRPTYPGVFNHLDDLFISPYESRVLSIPYSFLRTCQRTRNSIEVELPGLVGYAGKLQKKMTMNAFTAWNVEVRHASADRVDDNRFRIRTPESHSDVTRIMEAVDNGGDPPIGYVDAAVTMDPGYPYQYSVSRDPDRGDISLVMSPPPMGDVTAKFCYYETGPECVGIAAGSPLQQYEGVDEHIKSVQSIVPTQRLSAGDDRALIWDHFRSMLASRRRWLTKDDLRAAVRLFPPFSSRSEIVRTEKISFTEKVGRVNGFLTPYTEVTVPVSTDEILQGPDLPHFEKTLGRYLKQRTIQGNFVRARLVSESSV